MTDITESIELLPEEALASLVGIEAHIPEDAMSASLLGTERSGHGVRIRDDGLIVTIGYVVSEAEEIWIRSADDSVAPGVVIANDFQSGLALIRPTTPLPGPRIVIGTAEDAKVGNAVTACGSAGIDPQCIEAQVVARQEFAGRWEYVLDDAIFTAPAHQNWSGSALLDLEGRLVGIGSLVIQGFELKGSLRTVNMFVPIDGLISVIDEICEHGRRLTPPRPWLGFLVHEEEGDMTVVGVYRNCPADNAGLRPGDIVIEVNDQPVRNLANLFRSIWSMGSAGIDISLTVLRNSKRVEVVVKSSERSAFLRRGTVQ